MFQFTDSGKVRGIKGNVDINEMDSTFFKSIDSGVSLIGNANPPSSYRKGDSGLGVKELQQNLLKLGEKLPRYGADGSFGEELEMAVKSFQARNKLEADGIAGKQTLAKIADQINEISKPKEEDLPKVTSLGDKYSFQVRAKKDIGVYKYSNLAENQRIIKKDTVFSVYGYTEGVKAYAVPGGFVQAQDVDTLPMTIKTGGLNQSMENEFRIFLKNSAIDNDLHIYAQGNPSAEITVSGLDLVKVRQFLDDKGWWYR